MASVQIPRLLTINQACEFLGVSKNGLYIACREGRVPHYKVGGLHRFDLDE